MEIYQYLLKQHQVIKVIKKLLAVRASAYKKELELETTIVGDSALYSKENLELLKQIKWRAQSSFIDI